MKLKELLGFKEKLHGGFQSRIHEHPDHGLLLGQVGEFFDLSGAELLDRYLDFSAFYEARRYPEIFQDEKAGGERKHLCREEALLCYFVCEQYRPEVIVEIGTQYGVSTRKIIDIKNHLGLDAPVVCYDIENRVKYFQPSEAELIEKDIANDLESGVFGCANRGYLNLDAHPYQLTKDAVELAMARPDWPVTVHDCGVGLCNPHMEIDKSDPNISSLTGHWERHVLAEVFHVTDPLSSELDDQKTDTHCMRIFETPHGGCVIRPQSNPQIP